jgi:hypothetical protein
MGLHACYVQTLLIAQPRENDAGVNAILGKCRADLGLEALTARVLMLQSTVSKEALTARQGSAELKWAWKPFTACAFRVQSAIAQENVKFRVIEVRSRNSDG